MLSLSGNVRSAGFREADFREITHHADPLRYHRLREFIFSISAGTIRTTRLRSLGRVDPNQVVTWPRWSGRELAGIMTEPIFSPDQCP